MLIAALIMAATALSAQTPKDVVYTFTEASDLNLIGKIHKDTPNPYHRVDTVKYKGFTKGENFQVRCPAGLAVLFKTNSSVISVKTEYGQQSSHTSTMPLAYRGYDLYIKDGNQWLWAGAAATKPDNEDTNIVVVKDMDNMLKILMVDCGTNDSVVGKFPLSYHKIMTTNKVNHIWYEVPGADHDSKTIQSGYYNFLRYVFK